MRRRRICAPRGSLHRAKKHGNVLNSSSFVVSRLNKLVVHGPGRLRHDKRGLCPGLRPRAPLILSKQAQTTQVALTIFYQALRRRHPSSSRSRNSIRAPVHSMQGWQQPFGPKMHTFQPRHFVSQCSLGTAYGHLTHPQSGISDLLGCSHRACAHIKRTNERPSPHTTHSSGRFLAVILLGNFDGHDVALLTRSSAETEYNFTAGSRMLQPVDGGCYVRAAARILCQDANISQYLSKGKIAFFAAPRLKNGTPGSLTHSPPGSDTTKPDKVEKQLSNNLDPTQTECTSLRNAASPRSTGWQCSGP
jgi:hypothetical protein